MALLIFNTQNLQVKNYLSSKFFSFGNHNNSDNNTISINNNINNKSESGLYDYRYLIYIISFLFPILLASISYYMDNPYQEFVYMAFFRIYTGSWWFSWSIRHVIAVGIIVIYITIYVYVMMQFKKVSKSFKKRKNTVVGGVPESDDDNDDESFSDDEDNEDDGLLKNTFGGSLWYTIFKFLSMLVFPDVRISAKLHGHSLKTDKDLKNIEKLKNESSIQTDSIISDNFRRISDLTISNDLNSNLNLNNFSSINYANIQKEEISKQIQNLLYDEAMDKFNSRKLQIMKQMKIIFIYPISFILLWLFPFIDHYQVIRFKYETMWSTAPSAVFQPMSCFVDTIVFLIREKPWQLTENINQISNKNNLDNDEKNWRYYISWLPGYGNYGNISKFNNSQNSSFNSSKLENQDYFNNNNNNNNNDDFISTNDFNESDEMSMTDFLNMKSIPNTKNIQRKDKKYNQFKNNTQLHPINSMNESLINIPTKAKLKNQFDWNTNMFENSEMDIQEFLKSGPTK